MRTVSRVATCDAEYNERRGRGYRDMEYTVWCLLPAGHAGPHWTLRDSIEAVAWKVEEI